MSRFPSTARVLLLAAAGAAGAATVQDRSPGAASPATTQAPAAAFTSVFDGYRAFGDESVKPWRESNDTVRRIGGWRAYAAEGQAAPPAASGASAASQPAVPAGHRH